MDKAKEDMSEENSMSRNTKEELEKTKEENYPSVFLNRNPSQDLKKLRGKMRSFQSSKK